MNKYCKGKLFLLSDVNQIKLHVDTNEQILDTSSKEFLEWFNSLDNDSKQIIETYFCTGTGNKDALNALFTDLANKIKFQIPYIQDIIYELIQDKSGEWYGREIITNTYFPIIKKKSKLLPGKKHRKIFYYANDNRKVFITFNESREYIIDHFVYESPLIDADGNKYIVSIKGNDLVAISENNEFIITRAFGRTSNLFFELNSLSEYSQLEKCFIEHGDVITLGELGKYYQIYGKGIANRKFAKLLKKLKEMNTFRQPMETSPDEVLLEAYYPHNTDIDILSYIKSESKKSLSNLEKNIYPLTHLSIYDIDKLVEKIKVNDMETGYYIGFLYTMSLFDLAYREYEYDFNNSHIHEYISMIIITIKRLKRLGYVNYNVSVFDDFDIYRIVDLLKKSDDKVKKLV